MTVSDIIKEIEAMRDMKYPPNRFTDSYTGFVSRGVQEDTHVRPATKHDLELVEVYDNIITMIQSKE